jgi:hypothetical protein
MALEFSYLGDDGSCQQSIPIGWKTHDELVNGAKALGLDQLARFTDYYADAEVTPEELPSLAMQCAVLREKSASAGLREFLAALEALIKTAATLNRSIHAFAD